MRDEPRDALDALIDDTAREMTAGVARRALRIRFVTPPTLPWWKRPLLIAPTSFAGGVLVAMVAIAPARPGPVVPQPPRVQVAQTPSAAPMAAAAPPVLVTTPAPTPVRRRDATGAVPTRDAPMVATVEPLSVEPLQVRPLVVERLDQN